MKNIPLLVGTIVGTLILVIGVAVIFSNQAAPAEDTRSYDQAQVVGNEPHVLGATESARITITEYSDFQCPACAATAPSLKQVVAQYPEDVQLVYRHFPLSSIHPYAQLTAQASEVAAEENLFWEYHDLLFERQSEWAGETSLDAVRDILSEYAVELGIDRDLFLERIGSEEIKQRVIEDLTTANELDLNSTPTLFVNDQKVSAPSQLPTVIESLLEQQ